MACGPALVLNLLRWKEEIRPWNELNLPAEGMESTGLSKKEMAMGEQLVEDMSTKWEPQAFTDSFKEQILQLVKEKVAAGKTEFVTRPEEAEAEPAGAKIYDLTEILRRSLKKTGAPTKRAAGPASGRGRQASKPKAAAKRAAPAGSSGRSRKTAAKKPGKTASRSRKAA
jgi:DNA end-binding protein Ku